MTIYKLVYLPPVGPIEDARFQIYFEDDAKDARRWGDCPTGYCDRIALPLLIDAMNKGKTVEILYRDAEEQRQCYRTLDGFSQIDAEKLGLSTEGLFKRAWIDRIKVKD